MCMLMNDAIFIHQYVSIHFKLSNVYNVKVYQRRTSIIFYKYFFSVYKIVCVCACVYVYNGCLCGL